MKRFFILFLVFVLCVPFASAEGKDPIIGAWYIMLDYKEGPSVQEAADKNYMIYILFFNDDGTIDGISAEDLQSSGMVVEGASVGKWSNDKGVYTANIMGIGSSSPTIENDRLLLKMVDNIYYSMRRLDMGDWYTDIVYRYN